MSLRLSGWTPVLTMKQSPYAGYKLYDSYVLIKGAPHGNQECHE